MYIHGVIFSLFCFDKDVVEARSHGVSVSMWNRQCCLLCFSLGRGGGVAQSVERTTPGEEVVDSIPTVATRFLLAGSVSV